MSKYAWIITKDHLNKEGRSRIQVGKYGPHDITLEQFQHLLAVTDGRYASFGPVEFKTWRCLDADGNIYYEGVYIGPEDGSMFNPLDEFCKPHDGAVTIEYQEWKAL